MSELENCGFNATILFNNLIIAIKLPRRRIKASRCSEAAKESEVGILSFLSKQIAGYRGAVLQKVTLSHAFLKDFANRFSWQWF